MSSTQQQHIFKVTDGAAPKKNLKTQKSQNLKIKDSRQTRCQCHSKFPTQTVVAVSKLLHSCATGNRDKILYLFQYCYLLCNFNLAHSLRITCEWLSIDVNALPINVPYNVAEYILAICWVITQRLWYIGNCSKNCVENIILFSLKISFTNSIF